MRFPQRAKAEPRQAASLQRELLRCFNPPAADYRVSVVEDSGLAGGNGALRFVLAVEGRVALTLRVACGLTTAEIARAFLVPEKTLGQRIFRAKKTLSEAHVPFETPRGDELRKRVESVLSVVYLIFNEGYTATCWRGVDAGSTL